VISEKLRKDSLASIKKARMVTAPENSLGQWIGYCLWHGTQLILSQVVNEINSSKTTSFELHPIEGGKQVRLPDEDGTLKQIDHAIYNDQEPIVIVESKWLKDQRHLNDKGSWLKLMREIVRESKSIKRVVLVLGGPWENYRSQMENRGFSVIITSVEEVYKSLSSFGVKIDIDPVRNAFIDPKSTLGTLLNVIEEGINRDINMYAEIGLKMLGPSHRKEIEETVYELLK
jgi:hypothetical protein